MTLRTVMEGDLPGILNDWDDAVWNNTIIKCVFSNPFELSGPGEIRIEDRNPTALVKTSDVVGISQGDFITISGTRYIVREIQPDETGATVLILSQD